MSLIMPACILIIEIAQNQLLLEWRHLVYQYLFTMFYMVVTALWQVGTGDAVIFPETLDWICATRTEPDDDSKLINDPDCLWSQCISWFLIFAVVQTACYISILLIHYGKAKFCCRHSIPLDDRKFALINNQES